MEFRWNEWNIDHIAGHGVVPEEAEWVAANASPPFPEKRGEDKWAVWGPAPGGRLLQVIFVVDEDGTLFVIHARPLNRTEKRRYRKRRKP